MKNQVSRIPFIEEHEEVARQGLRVMKEYLAYEGSNGEYLKKAKIGATAVASYTRHYASLTNREMLRLAQARGMKDVKALGDGEPG